MEHLSSQSAGDDRALQQLTIVPDYLLIDAMQLDVLIEQKSLIKATPAASPSPPLPFSPKPIATRASKNWTLSIRLRPRQHKAIPLPEHMEALRLGPTPLHRYSFALSASPLLASGATKLRCRLRFDFLAVSCNLVAPNFHFRYP